jgi:beta-lactamase class A
MNMIMQAGRNAGGCRKRRFLAGPPLFFVLMLCGGLKAEAQDRVLQDSVAQIALSAQGEVGVAVLKEGSGLRFGFNGGRHFPMQSVYKFPLGLYILHQVDQGRLSLDQTISIRKKDWEMNTHSPMRDKYQAGDVDVSLREVLGYTITFSDNNGCDLLFRLAGGPGKVNDYVHGLGIKDMAIVATEAQMHAAWDVQYTNWSTPAAMAALLQGFYSRKYLSAASDRLMLQWMTAGDSRIPRISALLPPGTIVARKAGTSDTNAAGVAGATNDAGIITLPDGGHLFIVVFVKDSKADMATREGVIARIARAAYEVYGGGAGK